MKIDRRDLARYDLDLGDRQDYIETAMGGHVASELWDGEKRIDVAVRYPPPMREDRGAVSRGMIPVKDGSILPRPPVVVVGGTIGASALTLIVLPPTYSWAYLLRARLLRTSEAPLQKGP